MRRKDLFQLCRQLLRKAPLLHLSVFLGIVLVSTALAVSPLGKTMEPEPIQPAEAARSATAKPASSRPEDAPASAQRESDPISARGDRPLSAASATSIATPAPTSTKVPTPVPTAAPAPTAPPKQPTAAPTAAPPPTAAPTQPPASASALSQLRVGLQAGHWKNSELPSELASLRGSTGAAGSGWREVDVNLSVAQKVAAILRDKGIQVDLIPATVPVAYKADAFISIHGDANSNPSASGYKLARATWSKIPQKEDALIQAITATYAASTGLKYHPGSITANMRQYYGFNWRSLQHAVAPTTPSAIIELGFLTTASDRKLLLEQPDRAAEGIAQGIIRFLSTR